MWILLKDKLPVNDAPPKLSIFWSTPWPQDTYAAMQQASIAFANNDLPEDAEDVRIDFDHNKRRRLYAAAQGSLIDTEIQYRIEEGDDTFPSKFGYEPNWIKARQILYKGQAIRVFPHEYTEPSRANILEYIRETHTLVPEGVAGERLVQGTMDTDAKVTYDAALVDGADPAQAMLTALGMDVTMPDDEIPQVGWYKVKPEYGLYYCSPKELNLTDEEAQAIIDEIEVRQ